MVLEPYTCRSCGRPVADIQAADHACARSHEKYPQELIIEDAADWWAERVAGPLSVCRAKGLPGSCMASMVRGLARLECGRALMGEYGGDFPVVRYVREVTDIASEVTRALSRT